MLCYVLFCFVMYVSMHVWMYVCMYTCIPVYLGELRAGGGVGSHPDAEADIPPKSQLKDAESEVHQYLLVYFGLRSRPSAH